MNMTATMQAWLMETGAATDMPHALDLAVDLMDYLARECSEESAAAFHGMVKHTVRVAKLEQRRAADRDRKRRVRSGN